MSWLSNVLKNGIDPKWMVLLVGLIDIQKGIGAGAVSLTNMIPESWIPHVLAWNTGLAWLGIQVVGILAALCSKATGPMIPNISLPSIDVTKTAARVLLVAFAVSFLLAASPSMAQGLPNLFAKPASKTRIKATAAPKVSVDPLQKMMTDIENVQQTVVNGVIADLQAADADAATLTNASDPTSFRDPIAHACYPAAEKFLQSLPAATAPTGKFVLIQLFQKKRDFQAQIQAGLPVYLKMGCAPLIGDEVAIFTKMMGLVGVTVSAGALTGLFPAAAPLTLPALTL